MEQDRSSLKCLRQVLTVGGDYMPGFSGGAHGRQLSISLGNDGAVEVMKDTNMKWLN